jgi:putative DNA methylase
MACPRLIEVALPIREISAESVRDKNIHHAHISHLHIWWARRPLAASRAVVFSSLVPDPDHPDCPKEFRDAVSRLLKDRIPSTLRAHRDKRSWVTDVDPYRPYDGIEDTPRNRLLMFIARWSSKKIAFDAGKIDEVPAVKEILDDRCLAKWETSDPENQQGQEVLRIARELITIANDGEAPTLLDSFAGGGAIPLEASRIGCQPIANDYNPVAYLILRATCEFPQRYGRRLVTDIQTWADRVLELAQKKIGHLYPIGADKKPVVAYLWARTAPCSNPTCRTEIPLLRNLVICNRGGRRVALGMTKQGKDVVVGVVKGQEINETEGTTRDNGASCPICHQITSVDAIKRSSFEGTFGERIVAVVTEAQQGKNYRAVEKGDVEAFEKAVRLVEQVERPPEAMPASPDLVSGRGWNFKTWGSLFNDRQLVAMQTLIECLQEALAELRSVETDTDYVKAVALYLALWIDRVAAFGNSVTRWRSSHEKSETPFGGQAIPMIWDYPEVNPFADSSGTASTQLRYMLKVVEHECPPSGSSVKSARVLCGDGAKLPLESAIADFVVTDPPYFDAIAYADLSDFFYVWLKRSLGEIFPRVFTTPLTPKQEEATALKHRHGGDRNKAKEHFTTKLADCLKEAKRICKPNGVLAVMFAHQSSEAWTALINALFEAGLTVTATYPIETEMKSTALALGTASLESSITVTCRPREVGSAASLKNVRKEIDKVVASTVHRFFDVYGFKGADLIVSCYGPAVGVFGKYERVERADGTPVGIPELLKLAKESALRAIAGEFTGDELSRIYFVWANLYGTGEQSWDDARLVVMVGADSEDAMEVARKRGLFVVDGAICRLALLKDRSDRRHMGDEISSPLIDQLHHAMQLWKEERRADLINYLRENELPDNAAFWKLTQALFEVLPRNEEDWKIVSALLGERETLRKQARRQAATQAGSDDLPFELEG